MFGKRVGLGLSLLVVGCTSGGSSGDGDKAQPDPKPSGVEPRPQAEPSAPVQTSQCPLTIEPGARLGPVALGMSKDQLAQTELKLVSTHQSEETEFLNAGTYRVELCAGVVNEVWIEDLRLAPDCVELAGQPVDRKIEREAFIGRFEDCKELPPRIGGSFTECNDGGIRIGYGMGEFIQVRINRPGSDLDDDCSHALDDGSPVSVEEAAFTEMLEQVLNLDQLSPYWHVTEPGRRPLRVVGEVLPFRPPRRKFGEPVVYVTNAQAQSGDDPYLEFTSFRSTATRAKFEFEYGVEGVAGTVEFVTRLGDWRLHHAAVAER